MKQVDKEKGGNMVSTWSDKLKIKKNRWKGKENGVYDGTEKKISV